MSRGVLLGVAGLMGGVVLAVAVVAFCQIGARPTFPALSAAWADEPAAPTTAYSSGGTTTHAADSATDPVATYGASDAPPAAASNAAESYGSGVYGEAAPADTMTRSGTYGSANTTAAPAPPLDGPCGYSTTPATTAPPYYYGTPGTAKPAESVVYRAKHLPVDDLANTLEAALPADVELVSEPINNTLILTAPKEQLAAAAKLVKQLDTPPARVDVEVAMIRTRLTAADVEALIEKYVDGHPGGSSEIKLGELVQLLASPGRPSETGMLSLTTLDNQAALVQVGQRVPRRESHSLENVGRILGVTPRVADGRITMEIDLERSEVLGETIGTTVIQTTVALDSGQIICIGAARLMAKSEADQLQGEQILCLLRAVAHESQ